MSRKVLMYPSPSNAIQDTSNSINQIVLRMQEYLPMYGWEITENRSEADLIAVHAGTKQDIETDVAHCHGLYPTAILDEPDKQWHYAANENVIFTLKAAKAVTVPSAWVADILRRDMNISPDIIPWGIARKEWQKGAHEGYTLWNKTRPDLTCDPTPIDHLAMTISDSQFVTTFTNMKTPPPNLRVTGRLVYQEMKSVIQSAALYLATTKETWGIGTVEALACGIPVLGYKWGATPDIVEHGVHGYLVEPYDLEGLVQGWRWCMANRKRLSENARERGIEDFYLWERVAEQTAEVYDRVYDEKMNRSPIKVSVVIPCYNYGAYISEAIASVVHQETNFGFELIVVDDASTDSSSNITLEVLGNATSSGLIKQERIQYLAKTDNEGVAAARNTGIEAARGEYIVCLDADDRLGSPLFLQTLSDNLDKSPFTGLVYTGLGIFNNENPQAVFKNAWPEPYDANKLLGMNQVPTCNMFRKRAWQQAGGFKAHYTPAEDAALWLAIAMRGWEIKQVSSEPLFFYRVHSNSLSSVIRKGEKREPNWRMAFEGSSQTGYPFASIAPSYDKRSHPVRNYDNPLISIVIPVGKGHEKIVQRAIDCISGQSEWRWECIIVNDTGHSLEFKETWLKECIPRVGSSVGAGAARNEGAKVATGKYLLFLDADDYLASDYLERVLLHSKLTGRYVYTDTQLEEGGKFTTVNKSKDYSAIETLRGQLHPITALIPKRWFDEVGGFDDSLASWEDWDLFVKLAVKGFCGSRIPEPLFIYGFDLGTRREEGAHRKEELKSVFYQRYHLYIEGKKELCKCEELIRPKTTLLPSDDLSGQDLIRVMLIKGGAAKATVIGASGKRYARAQVGDTLIITRQDAEAEPQRFRALGNDPVIDKTTPPPPPNIYKGMATIGKTGD